MNEERTRVKFLNKDDFYEVCAMLKRLKLDAEGADVKYWVLYFKHYEPVDKEKYFENLDREVQKEMGKLQRDWAYGRKKD